MFTFFLDEGYFCSDFINQGRIDLVFDLVVANGLYLRRNFTKLGEVGLKQFRPQALDGHILIEQVLRSIVRHIFIGPRIVIDQFDGSRAKKEQFILILLVDRPEGLPFGLSQLHVLGDKELLENSGLRALGEEAVMEAAFKEALDDYLTTCVALIRSKGGKSNDRTLHIFSLLSLQI